MTRPLPYKWNDVSFRVVRGPNKSGAWYWRATVKESGKERTICSFWCWADFDRVVETYVQHDNHVLADGIIDLDAPPDTFGTVLDKWLTDIEDDTKPSTLSTYKDRRRSLAPFVDHIDLSANDINNGLQLVRAMRSTYSDVQVNNLITVVHIAWQHGLKHNYVQGYLHLDRIKKPVGVREKYTPTDHELDQIETALVIPWSKMVFRISRYTGARIGEIASLNWSSIDFGRNTLTLTGKTGPRTIPLHAALKTYLEAWHQDHPTSMWTTNPRDFYRHVTTATKVAGLSKHVSNHSIRRAFVRRLMRGKVDIKTAATFMGHSEVVMLSMYSSTTLDDMRDALDKLDF